MVAAPLVSWVRSSGAYLSDVDVSANGVGEERAVYARQAFAVNDVVLSVPLHCLITADLAMESPVVQRLLSRGMKFHSPHTSLALFLLQHRRDPSSRWQPYLQSLPASFPTVPVEFTDANLFAMLTGTIAETRIRARQAALRSEYANLLEHCPDLGYDDFRWARTVVITRVFGVVIDGRRTCALVPMADMLNHRPARQTSWRYDQDQRAFVVRALEPIAVGQEILDNYGRKCNSRWLVNYGFALEPNPDNETRVWIGLAQGHPLNRLKQRLFGACTKEFRLQASCQAGQFQAAMSHARLVCSDEEDVTSLSRRTAMQARTDHPCLLVPPISHRNERAALHCLREATLATMQRFQGTLADDNEMLGRTDLTLNERNCIVTRRGEKIVCAFFLDLFDAAMATIDGKPVPGSAPGDPRFDPYLDTLMMSPSTSQPT
ncbi:hypothetical protein PBRA_006121 [Plasmodiophora brassicae]|nr:hypothetical protein PBRA_006121 [Plasmodiophora brassicae]